MFGYRIPPLPKLPLPGGAMGDCPKCGGYVWAEGYVKATDKVAARCKHCGFTNDYDPKDKSNGTA